MSGSAFAPSEPCPCRWCGAVRDVQAEAVGTTTLPVRSVGEILDDGDPDPMHYEPDEYVDAEIVDDNALEQGEGTA